MSLEDNTAFGEQFIDHMREIAARHPLRARIVPAPEYEDLNHATDLLVIQDGPARIACRARRLPVPLPWLDQFTIRSRTRNGSAQTELKKIHFGWGDYLIYGFGYPGADLLDHWLLADLAVFRRWFEAEWERLKAVPGDEQTNDDGSRFRVYGIGDLPDGFLLERDGIRIDPPPVPEINLGDPATRAAIRAATDVFYPDERNA